MRGHFVHNRILIAPIEERLVAFGSSVVQEYPVRVSGRTCFVDLFATYNGIRISVEAELSTARISNDIAKAISLNVDLLLILVPTASGARAIKRHLKRTASAPRNLTISILTLGVALNRLRDQKSFLTLLNVLNWKTNPNKPKPDSISDDLQ